MRFPQFIIIHHHKAGQQLADKLAIGLLHCRLCQQYPVYTMKQTCSKRIQNTRARRVI